MSQKKEKNPGDVRINHSDRAALMEYARGRPSNKGVISAWTGLRTKSDLFSEVCHVIDNLRLNHGVIMDTEYRRDAGANETCGFIVFRRSDGSRFQSRTRDAKMVKIGEYRFTSLLAVEDLEFTQSHRNWTPEGLRIAWVVENSYDDGKGLPDFTEGLNSFSRSYPHLIALHPEEEPSPPEHLVAEEPSPPGNFGQGTHLRLVKEHTVKMPRTTFLTVKSKGSRNDN